MATLDVIARHPERFEVVGLTAQHRLEELFALCLKFSRATSSSPAPRARQRSRARSPRRACAPRSGTAPSALRARRARRRRHGDGGDRRRRRARAVPRRRARRQAPALANKEALVVGGDLFMRAVKEGGATLLPIDSEHSAIFQCLPDDRTRWAERIDHIVLTASGGPFRGRLPATLADVTPEQACAHPNWVMGRKISVDSATMMNKALEVIEAHFLFDLAPERIQVVIHPQSIIHSMVVCRDQSVLAQLGTADMRVPIAYGLAWPERIASGTEPLDWRTVASLTFEDGRPRLLPGARPGLRGAARPAGHERRAQRRQRGGGGGLSFRNHPLRPDSQGQRPDDGGRDPRGGRGRFARGAARPRCRGAAARGPFPEQLRRIDPA
jgi:1-deoxy-D-xylulose-5-phosphate reductoisomerase